MTPLQQQAEAAIYAKFPRGEWTVLTGRFVSFDKTRTTIKCIVGRNDGTLVVPTQIGFDHLPDEVGTDAWNKKVDEWAEPAILNCLFILDTALEMECRS